MSPEVEAIADSVERVLSSQDLNAARRVAASGQVPQALWGSLTGIGLHLLLVPEESGGIDAGFEAAVAAAMALGRHAAPVAMAETVFANSVKAQRGEPVDDAPCALALAAPPAGELLPWARMALLRAAQMAGAMQACAALTQQYAQDRTQFGKALVDFQVVQHQLASLAAQSVACRTAVLAAASRAGGADEAMYAGVAKARASSAAAQVAALAHQVHGAIGFTEEYGLHPFTTRLWAWRDDYGHESWWHEWLGRMAVESGGAGTWALIAADPPG